MKRRRPEVKRKTLFRAKKPDFSPSRSEKTSRKRREKPRSPLDFSENRDYTERCLFDAAGPPSFDVSPLFL
jgi:hypothetical protein